MTFIKNLVKQGNILFRWRSYLPLILVPPAISAALHSGCGDQWFGEAVEEFWMLLSLCISVSGLLVRSLTVGFAPPGTSGRNTREQRAETLNTSGMYSILRNPLYFGNYLILLGFSLATQTLWFPLITSLSFALYYERIICAEESFLLRKFGKTYTNWSERTPAFVPKFNLWRRPELPFSFRAVLRREYHSLFLIACVITVIEFTEDVVGESVPLETWLEKDFVWPVFLSVGALIFFSLRLLKKNQSRFLRVPGR